MCAIICTRDVPECVQIICKHLERQADASGLLLDFAIVTTPAYEQRSVRVAHLVDRAASVISPVAGFATPRVVGLRWLAQERPGLAALFIDDDDIPGDRFISEMWRAHEARPDAILGARVVRSGTALPPAERAIHPVKFHGASGMLIPNHLVIAAAEWIPTLLDDVGGEDTVLSSRARRSGIEVLQVDAAVATQRRSVAQDESCRQELYAAWLFSWLGKQRLVVSAEAGVHRRVASASRDLVVGVALLAGARGRDARRRFSRAAGALLGTVRRPPPRDWAFRRSGASV